MTSEYTKTTNDNQVEKELVAAASIAQSNGAQSADGQGNDKAERSSEHIPAYQEITQALDGTANANSAQPLPPQKLPTEETMRKAYEQVQKGKMTDPQAIRQIAMTFEAVARDPEASQKVTFDVERAATNLYQQAEHYEEMYRSSQI
jgi:hypothetical protein